MRYISNIAELVLGDGSSAPVDGWSSITCRLQLGSADELKVEMPMRTSDGKWRADLPAFQVGQLVDLYLGYDGRKTFFQRFELVGHEQRYSSDSFEIHGLSALAACARYKAARVFTSEAELIDQICADNAWVNRVDTSALTNMVLSKKAGVTDLEVLNKIAKWAKLGGPRVNNRGEFTMPHPDGSSPFVVYRGYNDYSNGGWPLIEFAPSREGGNALLIEITGWDPVEQAFVSTLFQPDEFSGDPVIVNQRRSLSSESSTTGLLLKLVEDHPDRTKKPRYETLNGVVFGSETDPVALAKRWFAFRERVSRWADITVSGHPDLIAPHRAVNVVGDVAAVDRGVWLPQTIIHKIDSNGWQAEMNSIRVVEESSVIEGQPV